MEPRSTGSKNYAWLPYGLAQVVRTHHDDGYQRGRCGDPIDLSFYRWIEHACVTPKRAQEKQFTLVPDRQR
jgi:hypothetical protein